MKKLTYRDGPIRDGAPTRKEYEMAEMSDLIDFTVIDNIDLKPTGTANQFTIEVKWTDGDGVVHTTTDPTPIDVVDSQSPWDNPDNTAADQSSGDIQYTEGNIGFGVTPEYGAHVAQDYIYAKSFLASGGTESAYIQRSNDGVGNFQQYWNTEGTSEPVRLSNGPVLNHEFSANSEWYQMRGAGTDSIGTAVNWTATHLWHMETGQHWFGQYGQGTFDNAAPARLLGVSSSGVVVEVDPDTVGGTDCPEPMTRSALIALAGSYEKDCHYVLTDYTRGTVGATSIELHAVDADTLSNSVSVKTTHDNMAWEGVYDIHANRMQALFDNENNQVKGPTAVDAFPWGVASVTQNTVNNGLLTYTAGTVQLNTIESGSDIKVNGGTFSYNSVENDAQITINGGNVQRNSIGHQSNLTVDAGDFLENRVSSDAIVNVNTTGDVDNNEFSAFAVVNVTGSASVDACTVKHSSNLTISGGSLTDTTLAEDSDVTFYGGSHYENHFGASVVFRQVEGTTAYVRYSTIEGTSTWVNGQVNLSNVSSYISTANTTGSVGTISNSVFNRAYMANMQDIPALTITDSNISSYGQISATGAAKLYVYRAQISSGGRLLVTADKTLNTSYANLTGYGYIQVLDGIATVNYTSLSGGGYVQHNTPGTNTISNSSADGRGTLRFLGTSTNCRIYNCTANGNGQIYHNGASTGCYIYYSTATGQGKMYSNGSVNQRCYYSMAASNGNVISTTNTSTHYQYYLTALSSGTVEMRSCDGSRMYSVMASSTSIARLQNSAAAGRLYYSSVTAYYYLYVTLTLTRSGLHAHGRRTNTVTDPAAGLPVENF